jgi:hypothetical protein
MQVMPFDRRSRRSLNRSDALHFQLVQVAEDFDLDMFVVADELGELIATSTRSADGTEISNLFALFSPMLVESRSASAQDRARTVLFTHLEELGMFWEADEIVVREFHVDGNKMLLVGVGEATTMREVGVYRAILGARRIWEQTHHRAAA